MRCFIWLQKTLLALLVSCTSMASLARSEVVEYSAGHGDIGLALEPDGNLFLHYHFGSNSIINGAAISPSAPDEYAPNEAYVRVADSNLVTLPISVPFLGLSSGQSAWILPQSNSPGRPFLGFATTELDGLGFTTSGFRMTSFSGPTDGHFAVWQSDPVGNSVVAFSTIDGVDPLFDVLNSEVNTHDHYNIGFTKTGIYEVGIEGFANGTLGNLTDSGIFTFVVGNATAVPEPSVIGFIALVSLTIFVRGWPLVRFRSRLAIAEE